MQIKILGGSGLHASERKAVAAMEKSLRSSWFAYASLLVVDDQGSMDIDVLIITHDRLLLVELKEWNGNLESSDGKWFVNGKYRSKSPYETKRVHALRLNKLLEQELKHKLGYYPLVEAHVVLCGSATPKNLSTSEKRFVHSLEEFLQIGTVDGYERITADQSNAIKTVFEIHKNPRPNSDKSLPQLKEFFAGPRIQPKRFVQFDFVANEECWFDHRNGLYKEYKGIHQESPNLKALIRRWDLNRLGTVNATQSQWESVVLREARVLNHVKESGNQLEEYMLRPISPLTVEDVNEDVSETYELRRSYQRLDEFIAKGVKKWSKEERADLVRALLAPFSELHGLGLAHRDIDGHNLWYASEQSSIIISGLATAFFPEKGTIKDLRKLLQSSYLKMPEDLYAVDGDIQDPYRQDVYMLGLLAYQICFFGQKPAKEDELYIWKTAEDDPFEEVLNNWFEKALDLDPGSRFSNASEMLSAFNFITQEVIDSREERFEVYDELISNGFVKYGWNVFSIFQNYRPMDGENPGAGNKLVYRSKPEETVFLCKVWTQIQISPDTTSLNRRLLQLKKKMEFMADQKLPLPDVHDYGLLEGGGLYVVTKYVEGETWSGELIHTLNEEARYKLANLLVDSVDRLHKKHISHGDIQPKNIVITADADQEFCYSVTLIDSIDIGPEFEVYNTEYGPTNPAITDAFGRDRFACYKLVREIFGKDIPLEVAEEIERGFSAPDGVPPSLLALEQALQWPDVKDIHETKKAIEILWGSKEFPESQIEVEQIDGCYQFNCRWDKRKNGILQCYITGISSQIQIAIDVEARSVSRIKFIENVSIGEVVSASAKSSEKIEEIVTIRRGNFDKDKEKALIDIVMDLETVIDELDKKYGNIESLELIASETEGDSFRNIKPVELWEALMSTEHDVLQCVEVDSSEIEENKNGNIVVQYKMANGASLNFEEDDQIFVSLKGDDSHLGELNWSETNLDSLSFRPTKAFVRKLVSKGSILNLESIRSKASRDRREKALSRVINRESVIKDLADYFDKSGGAQRIKYFDLVSEEDIRANYDTDSLKMNDKQIVAFQNLLSYGPVGVLQGPPGTGKTAFVSKFIHFLLDKCSVRNILLVGQSHTAVDTVAVKAREIFASRGISLDVVRIGHDSMIDEALLDAHPAALQRKIRQKFHRDYDQRIANLSEHLMLPEDLVKAIASLHRTINPLMTSYKHLESISNVSFQQNDDTTSGIESERLLNQAINPVINSI